MSASELLHISEILDGKPNLPGWQTRLARRLDEFSDRSVTQANVSWWTNAPEERRPPWWVTGVCFNVLNSAALDFNRRAIECISMSEKLRTNHLGDVLGRDLISQKKPHMDDGY